MTAAVVGALRRAGELAAARPGPAPRTRSARPPPRRAGPRTRRRPPRPAEVDLGVLVTEVATRLRTGAPVERAWAETLARMRLTAGDPAGAAVLGEGGVPLTLERLAGQG